MSSHLYTPSGELDRTYEALVSSICSTFITKAVGQVGKRVYAIIHAVTPASTKVRNLVFVGVLHVISGSVEDHRPPQGYTQKITSGKDTLYLYEAPTMQLIEAAFRKDKEDA